MASSFANIGHWVGFFPLRGEETAEIKLVCADVEKKKD